jgi:hypothetical protein
MHYCDYASARSGGCERTRGAPPAEHDHQPYAVYRSVKRHHIGDTPYWTASTRPRIFNADMEQCSNKAAYGWGYAERGTREQASLLSRHHRSTHASLP